MSLSENQDVFLADFGVAVVWEGVSGLGILDQPDVTVAEGLAISDSYSLLVKTAVFGGMTYQDPVTVAGENYRVLEIRKIDDGAFSRVNLEKL